MASEGKLRPLAKARPATPREQLELAARRRFRELRLARYRTQVECAVALGVDDSSVERWESGASKVPGWALVALAFETSSFVTRESAVRPALSGLPTAAEAFYLPKRVAKCTAPQSAPTRACTRFTPEHPSCVQGWATTPQCEASEGVARKAAA